MRLIAIATVILAASLAGTVEAAGSKAGAVRSKVAVTAIVTDVAAGKVNAKGKGVPRRVKWLYQHKRQVIVFEEAAPQDFLVAQDPTNRKGKWSATPTAGTYLSVPHHAIVVATTVRDPKTDRKFRCKGSTSASVTPSPDTP